MKKYFVNVIFENADGYSKGFDTPEEAKEHGEDYLRHLTAREKKNIIEAYIEYIKVDEDGAQDCFCEPEQTWELEAE